MSAFTPKQVAGKHYPLFETYYLSLDPTGKGQVPALEAAKFLKRSGLTDAILSKIWDLSDPNGKGYLDKLGVYVGLKLVAFAQNGRDVSVATILDDNVPEPEMSSGSRPIGPPPVSRSPLPMQKTGPFDWSIREEDMTKYRSLYTGIGPEGGKVPGAKAKNLLMESKLPIETLGTIWELSDTDKDGSLSEGEFIVAMHLVYKSLEKVPLPSTLPPELQKIVSSSSQIPLPRPPSLSSGELLSGLMSPPPLLPSVPISSNIPLLQNIQNIPPVVAKDNWIVPHDERGKFRALFQSTDLDMDGYVSGTEIKGVFLQSGLPQQTLAHIWNLCDTEQSGKLNSDQFVLALWLVSNALKGIQPPSELTPEMIPPGMTVPKKVVEPELPPEFELIMKEIRELTQEKLNLEMEIAAKESDKKIKSGETKTLQSELDSLAATLKQLENQKNVAQGKLSELDGQVSALRFQAEEQESKLVAQENELSAKASELDGLEREEKELLSQLDTCGREIERLGNLLQETLLQISQTKTRLSSLTEVEETMKTSLVKYSSAIESNNAYTITEPELRDVKSELDELLGSPSPGYHPEPPHEETSHLHPTPNGFPTHFDDFSPSWGGSGGSKDPFAPTSSSDPFAPPSSVLTRESPSPFSASDPFGSVPFEEVAPALPPKKAPPRPAPPKNAPARPPPPAIKQQQKVDPFTQQGDNFDMGFADFSQFNDQTWGGSSGSLSAPNHQAIKNNNDSWDAFSSPKSTTINTTSRGVTNINNNNSSNSNNIVNNNNHTNSSSSKHNSSSSLTTTTSPLDFTEDPFKNYRYEDPFENSDPFS